MLVRLAVVVGLVVAAVGLRAASPLEADGTPWRVSSLGHDRAALALIVTAVAVLLAVAVWTSRGQVYRGEGRRPRSLLASLGTLLLLVALAFLVPPLVHRLPPADGPAPEVAPTAPPASTAADGAPGGGHSSLALLVLLGVVAVVGGSVLRARARPGAPELPEPEDDHALSAGLGAAADVLRLRRDDAAPRERVVLAYAAFEQALAARGLERGPSGTPTALLHRAVSDGAPSGPATVLTEVFARARFSLEDVTETDVDTAERALTDLLQPR